jgi:hypothetical protein
MNPLIFAGAAAAALGSYYLLVEKEAADFTNCLDANLPPNIRAELEKMFVPEKGESTIERLLERATSYRNVAKILGKAFPLANGCATQRAEQIEAVVRASAKAAKEKKAKGPSGGEAAPAPGPATSKAAKPKAAPKAAPKPPPGTPGTAAVFGKFGLPPGGGPAREEKIKELVQNNRFRTVEWSPVDCSRDGVECKIYVSSDALALGDDENFVRLNAGHRTAEELAIILSKKFGRTVLLPTTRIMDKAWQQAKVKLSPKIFPASPQMSNTDLMYAHSRRVEKERAGRPGLVRPVGKGWVSSAFILGEGTHKAAQFPKKAAPDQLPTNFGWHLPQGSYKSPGGVPVIQPISNYHAGLDANYTDYSQVVYLVRGDVEVDGKSMQLADVLRHPTLSRLVSDEGPLTRIRHPSQPDVPSSQKPALAVV